MREILINYEDVYNRTALMRSYINDELIGRIDSAYATIQNILDQTDGKTNAAIKECMEIHKQKSIKMAKILDKLLLFMINSSKQVELHDQRLASIMASCAKKNVIGGES